jgi:mRNA interferase YafQ
MHLDSTEMLKPKYSKKFKRDIKKFEHQKAAMLDLREVIEHLLKQEPLEEKYCDHPLSGNWIGHRECHVKSDMLLIYKTTNERLLLARVGSHSELF